MFATAMGRLLAAKVGGSFRQCGGVIQMPRDPYDVDPAREQDAEDFCANLRPWVDSLQTVKDAGDKLFAEFGAGTHEGEYLDGVLDTLDDVVKAACDRLASDAEDIRAGTMDVPTSSRSAA